MAQTNVKVPDDSLTHESAVICPALPTGRTAHGLLIKVRADLPQTGEFLQKVGGKNKARWVDPHTGQPAHSRLAQERGIC